SRGPRGLGGTAGRQRLRRLVAGAAAVAAGLTLATAAGTPAFADGIRTQQWYLSAMKVADAQAAANGGGGVAGPVLDSGVDAPQADLTGNVLKGIDAETDSGDGQHDTVNHGTNMAAIIAGHGHGPGNADGVLGVAPKAKILPISLEGADPRSRFDPDK